MTNKKEKKGKIVLLLLKKYYLVKRILKSVLGKLSLSPSYKIYLVMFKYIFYFFFEFVSLLSKKVFIAL